MRKLTFGMNVSLDGYIAAPGDDLGWSVPSDELFQWWSDRVGATGLALCATGPHPTPLSDPPSVVLGEFAELVGDAAGAGAGRQVAHRFAAEPVADRVDRAVQRPAG